MQLSFNCLYTRKALCSCKEETSGREAELCPVPSMGAWLPVPRSIHGCVAPREAKLCAKSRDKFANGRRHFVHFVSNLSETKKVVLDFKGILWENSRLCGA